MRRYLGRRQMAAITGRFLAWEFELKDEAGHTTALIDRCEGRAAASALVSAQSQALSDRCLALTAQSRPCTPRVLLVAFQ